MLQPLKKRAWGMLVAIICMGMVPSGAMGTEPVIPSAHHCISALAHGKVDWSTGRIYVQGRAAPASQQAKASPDFILSMARSDARKNLVEILKQLPITGQRCVGDLTASDDHFLAGIETLAKNSQLIHQSYTSDYTMEVMMEATLFGGFLQLVLPETIRHIPTLKLLDPPPAPAQKKYTGLIIDATAMGFRPVLYPQVVSELGEPVYTALFISREFAVQGGVCRYLYSRAAVETAQWVGPHPLVITGLRKGGPGNGTIVISRADADAVASIRERHDFMRRCRVVILVAPEQTP